MIQNAVTLEVGAIAHCFAKREWKCAYSTALSALSGYHNAAVDSANKYLCGKYGYVFSHTDRSCGEEVFHIADHDRFIHAFLEHG